MPTNATLTLAHTPPATTRKQQQHLIGHLVYLSSLDAIVRVETRNRDDWLCRVVASRDDPLLTREHLLLTTDRLTEGITQLTLDPGVDPNGFATLIWHTTAAQRWPDGTPAKLARHLAHHIRPPGSLSVVVNPDTVLNLLQHLHVRGSALRTMIGWLVDAKLLTPTTAVADDRHGEYTLTLPRAGA